MVATKLKGVIMNSTDKEPKDISEVVKLLNTLISDPIDKQVYAKEIRMLFDILGKSTHPTLYINKKVKLEDL
jgi:hypothetical protein